VDQFPAGFTRHRVFGRASGGAESLLAELAGDTAAGQWLERSPPHGWSGVRYVRVETVESPSWVAWREIQVFGAFGP
jgi:hypothetical protein